MEAERDVKMQRAPGLEAGGRDLGARNSGSFELWEKTN